jgi:hypothetical protein
MPVVLFNSDRFVNFHVCHWSCLVLMVYAYLSFPDHCSQITCYCNTNVIQFDFSISLVKPCLPFMIHNNQ